MKSSFFALVAAAVFSFSFLGSVDTASAERCWSCSSSSSGSCSGADQCQGERAACQKAGCKIDGSHSCKTSSNITTCKASFFEGDVLPLLQSCDEKLPQLDTPPIFEVGSGDCFMCNKRESTGDCSGAEQCKASRKACRDAGCKITGTRSCSTAANVKTCG